MDAKLIKSQIEVCKRFGAKQLPAPEHLKVGIARNVKEGLQPINGLRIPPEGDTTGWYIWAGEEWSNDPSFFVPLHINHLSSWCSDVIPYLQLPAGWRFLIAPDHEDVWFDANLLQQEEDSENG
ncbi:MAG: hypothetical protein ACFCD0_01085 [Gemmataceae bacterium]